MIQLIAKRFNKIIIAVIFVCFLSKQYLLEQQHFSIFVTYLKKGTIRTN